MSTSSKMTFEEAEKILEYDMTDRDFWYVTDNEDNGDILQDVLDIIFNCIEGQNYKARYMHQTSHSRLVVYCGVCRKELSSYDPFITHDSGKPHKKAVAMLKSQKEKESMDSEVIFKDPLAPLLIFESGTLEDKIDHLDIPVVGTQFVYKERRDDILYFSCQLCMKKTSSAFRRTGDEMLIHITSNFHIERFMDIVHGIRDNFYSLISHAQRIMETNGKITHNIIEFEWDTNCVSQKYESRKRPLSPPKYMPPIKREPVEESLSVASCSSSKGAWPGKGAETSDASCQVDIPIRDIKEFVNELRICVKEQEAITFVLKDVTPNDKHVLSNTVKVFSNALNKYCRNNNDDEAFNKMIQEFNEFTSIL